MKAMIVAAIVIALEVGFVASIAMMPSPPASSQSQSEVVAGRNATSSPAAVPASRG